jgi:hypothetical protein
MLRTGDTHTHIHRIFFVQFILYILYYFIYPAYISISDMYNLRAYRTTYSTL